MAKIIDVDVLDNFKLRQDAVNDAWFLKRSNIEKEGNEIKIVTKEATSSQPEVSYMALTTESEIDASRITGVLDIDNIPPSAQERLVNVNGDNPASWGLTSNDVQKGDVVRVNSGDNTGKMYYVVDENNLNNTSGYKEFKATVDWNSIKNKPTSFNSASHTHAGTDITSAVANATNATKVPWSGVQNPPSTFPPSSHTHGNITNDGKINATAVTSSSPVVITSDGTMTRGVYESSIGGIATINAPQCIAVKNYVDNRSRIFINQQTNPNNGDIYYDTTNNALKIYVNGWITIGSGGSSSGGGSSTGGNTPVNVGDNLPSGSNILLQAYSRDRGTTYNFASGTVQTPDGRSCQFPMLQVSSDGINFSDVAGYQPGCAYVLGHTTPAIGANAICSDVYIAVPVISVATDYYTSASSSLYCMPNARILQILDEVTQLEGYDNHSYGRTSYNNSVFYGNVLGSYGTKYFRFNFRNDNNTNSVNYVKAVQPVSSAAYVSIGQTTDIFGTATVLWRSGGTSNPGDSFFSDIYGTTSDSSQSFYYGFGVIFCFTIMNMTKNS